MTAVIGAILAGGLSRRFGSDKVLASVEGRPLIEHGLDALRGVTTDVAVCGRDWPSATSLPDRPRAGMGPLSGLNAALHHARSARPCGLACREQGAIPLTTPKLSFSAARRCVAERVEPGPCETLHTVSANHRVVAAPVVAHRSSPPFAMSAMDGFAIGVDALTGDAGRRLRIGTAQFAGDPAQPLEPDEARPIYTGAAIPEGTGAVLVQERATVLGSELVLREDLTAGSNIRLAGEDARAGDWILDAGRRLNPATIGALCAYGVAQVTVRARPRVAMLVLGNELADVDADEPTAIIDTNGPMITGLLEDAGCCITHRQQITDDARLIEDTITGCIAQGADMILTSGGGSVGARDLLLPAILSLGADVHFHGVHMRPGKPVLFATLHERVPIFGLPGNPMAALVSARFFVMAAVRARYALQQERPIVTWPGTAASGPRRIETALGVGHASPFIFPGQKSHILRTTLDADTWVARGGDEEMMTFHFFDNLEIPAERHFDTPGDTSTTP